MQRRGLRWCIQSMEMKKEHKVFADEWQIDGNGTRAYKVAYPHIKNDKTAAVNANRLLKNAKVKAYIAERQEELSSHRLMTVQEALERSTSIARAEPQVFIYEEIDQQTGEILQSIKRRQTPRLDEQQRSIDHILKVNQAFVSPQEKQLKELQYQQAKVELAYNEGLMNDG